MARVSEFQHQLGCLSEEESWLLFKKVAFSIWKQKEGGKHQTVVEKICSEDTIGDDIEGLRVYAIWGMGGMGKTTLTQLVYNHERVKAHFELQAWVYVSNDFQVTKLTRGILESLDKNSPYEIRQLDVMQVELQRKLEGKRFLIVLDDVWIEDKDMKKWKT
ncbi:hypothetical protein OSB04_013775 [Centaurea solstitialis]|uniref:NB-ARC domain-containing protein n=1 Tax=Centaurea solstitialis TaxID=347529 RepID=A0AA38WRG4_9ASTR|nr:hypothetical protein OSB04_013775 [Centaurea solstitialis]